MFEEQLKKLEALEPLIEATESKDLDVLSSFLYERISNPDSYVVFLGETSSGKSSIINGLLGESILPVKASPSTASITEIELSANAVSDEYVSIYGNATFKRIDKETFQKYCDHPEDGIKRIRLKKTWTRDLLKNARLFDTPGYGSIVEKHEEVLKDFLPNSDVVVYVVAYNSGILDDDFTFLMSFNELVRDDVELILVINRCPDNLQSDDRRIEEIYQYVSNTTAKSPKLFCVPNFPVKDGQSHALPQCPELWEYIDRAVNSDYRILKLRESFDVFIEDLYWKCDGIIQSRYLSAKMSDDEYQFFVQKEMNCAKQIREAIPNLVEPCFEKLKLTIPNYIERAGQRTTEILVEKIDAANDKEMDDMIAYTKFHLLPYTLQSETKEIQSYVESAISELNNEVEDYVQGEVVKFNTEIQIQLHTNTQDAANKVGIKILQRTGTSALGKYFLQFGGAGGANAGIANAASHGLKTIGDIFGHTFKKETHNALKHFLSKIGATSMRAVSASIAVLCELVAIGIKYAIWKKQLKKAVKKGIENWKTETEPIVIKDLEVLKEQNIITIESIAKDIECTFENSKSNNADKCYDDVILSEHIANKLNIKHYK